jgi:alpha-1,3-fucosyltransferase
MIESTYKFYLTFENSICKDYVTESFFMDLYMVLIVYGGVDYTQQRAAPFLHRRSKFKNLKVGRLSENTRRRPTPTTPYTTNSFGGRITIVLSSYRRMHHVTVSAVSVNSCTTFKLHSNNLLISELVDDNKCQPFDLNLVL